MGIDQSKCPRRCLLCCGSLPIKRAKYRTIISDHLHLNVTYLFESDEKLPISIKEDENSSLAWIPIVQIDKVVTEERMIEIYQKVLKRI